MSRPILISQRSLVGIASIVSLIAGVAAIFVNQQNTSSVGGILIKVGLMLGATWLAMPSLMKPGQQSSIYVVGGMFVGIVLLAIRPRIFLAAIVIGGLALLVNFVLKRLASNR